MEPDKVCDSILALENLRFRWGTAQSEGLADVIAIDSFTITRGEKLFLKGPSGSGKTTLLSLIGGINVPQSGSISCLGTDLGALSQSARDQFRADHIGFIFQLFNLIPYLSVIENVVLACKFSKKRSKTVLSRAESLEMEARRLLGHMKLDDEELIAQPVQSLSVGQQQRVAVARALIGAPPLIIADEPTSALDADTRHLFIQLLMEECDRSSTTMVFVSHDGSLEANFDRSVNLNDINRSQLTQHKESSL